MNKQISTCILIISLFALLSCSADKKEFEKIQLQITNAENVANSTNDYNIQLEACDNSIQSLQKFIKEYPNSEWTQSANLSLTSWKSKKSSFKLKAEENIYKKTNEIVEEADKIFKSSDDFDVISTAYTKAVSTLEEYINQNPNSEWTQSAKLSLASWESKWESKKSSFKLEAEENAYKKTNEIVEEASKIIKSSFDFDVITTAYTKIVNTLEEYISQNPNNDRTEQSELALSSWKSKVVSFEKEINQLKNKLNQELKNKCKGVANKHHSMSKIELQTLKDSSSTKNGDLINTFHTYQIKMKGKILGTHVFNFQVKVNGYINMKTKTVSVNDKTEIIE